MASTYKAKAKAAFTYTIDGRQRVEVNPGDVVEVAAAHLPGLVTANLVEVDAKAKDALAAGRDAELEAAANAAATKARAG